MSVARTRALALAGVFLAGTGTSWAQDDIRIPPPVSGRGVGGAPLLAADLLARVGLLETRLEGIRVYMGRPKPPPPLIRVEGAQIREVLAQAIIFHQRVQSLGFEQLRTPVEPIRDRRPVPEDILDVLNLTLFRVLQLERHFGIKVPIEEKARPASSTPTEVFNAVLEAGQLAHELLDEKTSASITYSVLYLALQLARTIHAERAPRFLPPPTPFVPAKTAGDVYAVLLEAFELVRVLTNRVGIEGSSFEVRPGGRDVVPDDVLELSGILVSELFILHRVLLDRVPEVPFVAFTRKLPSHTFQRASDLKALLESLGKVRLTPPRRRK